MSDYQFRIKQTGFVVASGSAPDRDRMASLMGHYILLYAQDGPIEVETRVGKGTWKALNPTPERTNDDQG